MKASYVCLLFLSNIILSTLAFSLRSQEIDEDPDFDKRGVQFGTALGHKNKNSNYENDREKAFDKLFGREMKGAQQKREDDWEDLYNSYDSLNPEEKKKRAPFTFGTALGHSKGKDKGDYVGSLNAKFNELFGDENGNK